MNPVSIGGTMFLHNAIELDFCFREALASLLALCGEVVCLDCESTDGTSEVLAQLAVENPKLRVEKAEWKPSPGGTWLAGLANKARAMLTSEYHVHLQADEYLMPEAHGSIRKHAKYKFQTRIRRINFLPDPWHICPEGWFFGHSIIRGSVKETPMDGDAESMVCTHNDRVSEGAIHHYGFLRDRKAYATKARAMHVAYFGSYDPVIDRIETEGIAALVGHQSSGPCQPFTGQHPAPMHDWLRQRGFNPITP